jgi:hypothetical protein
MGVDELQVIASENSAPTGCEAESVRLVSLKVRFRVGAKRAAVEQRPRPNPRERFQLSKLLRVDFKPALHRPI